MTVSNSPQQGEARAYTPQDLRPVLKLGRDKIYELLTSGELRSVRVGRRWLIPAEAVAEFLNGGK